MIYKNGFELKQNYNDFLSDLKNYPRIVFTNGVFDLLHIGHIRYLKNAAQKGDILIVGINSNSSVKKLNKKGDRPIIDETERAEIISSLYFVNFAIIFNEKNPKKLIQDIKPEIFVKGGDYKIESLEEAKIVKSYGGQVVIGLLVEGRSTTSIISKLATS